MKIGSISSGQGNHIVRTNSLKMPQTNKKPELPSLPPKGQPRVKSFWEKNRKLLEWKISRNCINFSMSIKHKKIVVIGKLWWENCFKVIKRILLSSRSIGEKLSERKIVLVLKKVINFRFKIQVFCNIKDLWFFHKE